MYASVKRPNGSRFATKQDSPHLALNAFTRSACHGRTGNAKLQGKMRKAREEVLAKVAKRTPPKRTIRDRDLKPDSKPAVESLPELMASIGAPMLVRDSVLPANLPLRKVSNAPRPGEAPTIWSARKEAELETYLLQGVTDLPELAKLTGLKKAKCRELQARIQIRWAMVGSAHDVKQARGRSKSYVAQLNRTLWHELEQPDISPEQKGYILSLLIRLFGVELMLDGITPDSIEEHSRGHGDNGEVMLRMKKQKALCEVMGRFLDIIAAIRTRNGAINPTSHS